MFYTYSVHGVDPQDICDYARVLREIDEERRELALFAVMCNPLQKGFGIELTRHKDYLHDLSEQEELVMIRTRYIEFEPHWRAHRKFQSFLNKADSRETLLFCTDWLRQHVSSADTEFRQWLRHGCIPDTETNDNDCLYNTDPERILLSVKMQIV